MQEPNRTKVEQLFHDARALQVQARARFLDEACGPDSATRLEVERLLQHDAQLATFLNEPATKLMQSGDTGVLGVDPGDFPTVTDDNLPSWRSHGLFAAGQTLGFYRLIRQIGRGGFGQVWEAESLDTQRRLALKVLNPPGQISLELWERFKREGELAASINHPRCVFVFAAEEIEGWPTILMELMEGGTLEDEIRKGGPVTARRAVDYILDVIEGLEAAHAAGVIHRDVKPSNCFLDDQGRVKIGDFGISKSLGSDLELTQTGAFVGTPVYASPEQVRGREVDVRTDIYSVGATLYTLLTGAPPFAGGGAREALARVLTEDPAPIAGQKAELPNGLDRAVRRMMAKDPSHRYRDYAALREVLVPFSSRGLTTAGVGKRLAAYMVDSLIFLPVGIFIGTRFVSTRLVGVAVPSTGNAMLGMLLNPILSPVFYYFLLTERLWGRSVGKYLFGLRVTTRTGSAISWRQAFARSLVFLVVLGAPGLLILMVPERIPWWAMSFSAILRPLIVLITMRASNGYLGPHEWLSGTRVIAAPEREHVSVPNQDLLSEGNEHQQLGHVGPYRVLLIIWQTEQESLFLASDDILKRRVWVYRFRNPSAGHPMATLAATRAGRLRWLTGLRQPGNCWDAYEAPSGTSLVNWVTGKRGLSWQETRGLLLSLVTEMCALDGDGQGPDTMTLHHIWVDGFGQAKVLNFSAVAPDLRTSGAPSAPANTWQVVVQQVAVFALEGRLVPVDHLEGYKPHVPLPEHVRPVMEQICSRSGGATSISAVLSSLNGLADRPARVTRSRRAGLLMVPTVVLALPIIVTVFISSIMPLILGKTPFGDLIRYQGEWLILEHNQERLNSAPAPMVLEAYRKLMASSYAQLKVMKVADQMTSRGPYAAEIKRWSEAALTRYPSLTPTEVNEARVLVDRSRSANSRIGVGDAIRISTLISGSVVTLFAIPATICAFVLRGGLLLSLFGVAVQTREGRPAGRARCVGRAIAAWGLFLLFTPLLLQSASFVVLLGLWTPVLGATVIALFNPERGIPDILAGTYLVPR